MSHACCQISQISETNDGVGAVMGDDHVAARACSRSFSTLSIGIEREGRPEQTGLQTWKGSMTS